MALIQAWREECEALREKLKIATTYIDALEMCADGYYRITSSDEAKAWEAACNSPTEEQEYLLFSENTVEAYLATRDDERHKEEYTTLRQRAMFELQAFIEYLREQETNG